jgi:hypothetical protein
MGRPTKPADPLYPKRKASRAARADWVAEAETTNPTPNTDPIIGVVPRPQPEIPPPETLEYHCLKCQSPLAPRQNPCPKCNVRLEWSDVN